MIKSISKSVAAVKRVSRSLVPEIVETKLLAWKVAELQRKCLARVTYIKE